MKYKLYNKKKERQLCVFMDVQTEIGIVKMKT